MVLDSALIALAGSVFVASLIGSPHCAGMCGGFVCFFSAQDGSRRWLPHAAYHAGRFISYASLGALAGAIGIGIDQLGVGVGLQRGAAVVAGFALLVWGGLSLVRAGGVRVNLPGVLRRMGAPIAGAMRVVHAQPPAIRALVLGLVTTLLPCGWLYLYVAMAAGTGAPASGVVVMSAFWLGTVPVLAGLGFVAQRAIAPLRRRLPAFSAATLIVFGLLTITGKFHPVNGCAACRKPGVTASAARGAEAPASSSGDRGHDAH